MKPEDASCPECGSAGSLSVTHRLIARPLGTFSLSGMTPKVSAHARPVLSCSACPFERTGTYDPDGRHVSFPAHEQ